MSKTIGRNRNSGRNRNNDRNRNHDRNRGNNVSGVQKELTGIPGFDEITGGGLPAGRPTLICGSAGAGKTLFAMEFLFRGASLYNEPGVFMSFEESDEELVTNVASLGFDLKQLVAEKKLLLDYVFIERSEIEETGEYDLEGLFLRLDHAINQIGARRVILDTLEALFSALPSEAIVRAELRRLFRWLKEKGVTAVITCERGEGTLTRYGLEEYVADCVILLDNRIENQISTRRLRIIKYRGTSHGTNEYPFFIDEKGFSVLPITSIGLNHKASTQRVSSGNARLDTMLDGKGFYRGSSILVSGTAGTGKSTIAAHFVDAACKRGERALFFAFEESQEQIIRNMRSLGIDLEPYVKQGLLQFANSRPSNFGLEVHLGLIHKAIVDYKPNVVVVDPISNFLAVGGVGDTKSMLTRLIDLLKTQQITAMFTSLTGTATEIEHSEVGVSSLMDAWLLVKNIESNGERNRGLYILKARGIAHSNQVREFRLTAHGMELIDAYIGSEGVLMGSARAAQAAREAVLTVEREEARQRKHRELQRKQELYEAQLTALRTQFESERDALLRELEDDQKRESMVASQRLEMARLRHADIPVETGNGARKARKGSER
ncbi:MAG TPA: circadian clock protein KaiC [Pyrinomonadaceae bacterium]|nr:circadian clock protein KaiC [Pyrinomonadaceae bacterium]